MVKVSIIVPIYNVENYLEKCLESLVNQTLRDIEIILINDASPDNSDKIMERYAKQYDFVRTVYLKENRCLGGARNAGVELACGDYILFVDSDDYIDLDYCERMYQAICESGSDIAYSAYKTVNESYEETGEKLTYPIEFSGELTEGKKRGIINKGVFAWGKMYSRILWNKLGLTFPEHLKYEDAPTIPIYILHAGKCCYVDGTYYRYLIRGTSIVRTRNEGHGDAQKTALLFVERMKKYGLYDKYLPEIEHFMVQRYYCVFLRRCVQMYDSIPYDRMTEARDDIRKWFPDYEHNPYHFTFVAEDRLRMLMNEVSPYTCAEWDKKIKGYAESDDSFYQTMYYPFYEQKRDIIEDIMNGRRCVGLWGDRRKRGAFREFLNAHFADITVFELKDKAALEEADFDRLEIIAGVNPSACFTLHQLLSNMDTDVRIVNLEDVLHGYFEIGGIE